MGTPLPAAAWSMSERQASTGAGNCRVATMGAAVSSSAHTPAAEPRPAASSTIWIECRIAIFIPRERSECCRYECIAAA